MKAADDFNYIHRRMLDLRARGKVDPATCNPHSFDPATDRCIYCNLHYYHLPALENCPPADRVITSDHGSADWAAREE
jgi:hypothetical protein